MGGIASFRLFCMASVQPVEAVIARLLASPILQEYDASTADELARIAAPIQPVVMVAANECR